MNPNHSPSFIATSGSVVRVQAVSQRSWDSAIEGLALRIQKSALPTNPLLTLFRTGAHLRQVGCPEELMQNVLDDTVAVLEAQRGSIVLCNESGGFVLRKTSRAPKTPSFRKWYSRTLVERCFSRGESMLCENVDKESTTGSPPSVLRQSMSSILCVLLRTPRKKLGVLHLDRGPLQPPFDPSDLSLADAIAASVSAALETAQLIDDQRLLFLSTITALAHAVEMRDQYTGSHTQRVADYALMLAVELGLSAEEKRIVEIGTPLHDIGKIGVSDAVLRKPSALTADEFEEMKKHAAMGAELLQGIVGLRPVLPLIRHHHERWDGRGYPDRLAAESIPRLARIVAVADAFDAMTSDRPYRRALTFAQGFREIEAEAGRHFAPECARAFLSLRARIEQTTA